MKKYVTFATKAAIVIATFAWFYLGVGLLAYLLFGVTFLYGREGIMVQQVCAFVFLTLVEVTLASIIFSS